MASEAGIYDCLWRPDENGYTHAHQIIPHLEKGIERLKSDRQRFEQFNPANGWGDYDGLVRFAQECLEACQTYPTALIEVSR